jgi:hypothetical protein
LTIANIPTSAGETSHDDTDEGEGRGLRHTPRERVSGFGEGGNRSSTVSSRPSSRPMSRRMSQNSSKLLDLDPRNETLS